MKKKQLNAVDFLKLGSSVIDSAHSKQFFNFMQFLVKMW